MKIVGVIFDWAGTVVDHGSRAPVATLQDVFGGAGVPVTVAEARLSMGVAKREHIRSILQIPRVANEWEKVHGAKPAAVDVDSLYAAFQPKQLRCLGDYSDVIGGVPELVQGLRSRGMKIGSTTGYTRVMLDFLVERARAQGFDPDFALCPDDVPGGRPAPWMCWLNAIRMQVWPMWQMVKIGDTPSDIEEGQNAGMWTIGITRTGNEVGLTEAEWGVTPQPEQQRLLATAGQRLEEADYLAESVADCAELLEEISARIVVGEKPAGEKPAGEKPGPTCP